MRNIERISALLSSLGPFDVARRVDSLLAQSDIPTSSGYKILSDLVGEGMLERAGRGQVKLGPSAKRLFYAPLRAVPPPPAAPVAPIGRSRTAPRKEHFEGELLKMVSTQKYRKEPPFTVGFSNASRAHPWRTALEQSLVAAAQRQNHIVSRLITYDAENDPARQIADLLKMRDEGADLCIVSAVNETDEGLREAIANLGHEGMPIVGVDRICGDLANLVCFVTASDDMVGRISALWLAERLNGQGRIVMLCGLKGASPCTIRLQSALAVFADYPLIEIVSIDYTDWLAERGFNTMRSHLMTGWVPDGVWCDSGLQGIGSLDAFRKAGFRRGQIPPHTGGEMNLMYKMAVIEKVPLCGLDYPAAMGAISFQAALDILSGRDVPRMVEADLQIIVTRGHETKSVRADLHAEKKVNWSGSDSLVHATGRLRQRSERGGDASFLDRQADKSATVNAPHSDTVGRLLDIVTLVARRPVGTAYDIARTLELPLSSTYQIVNELERLSWLVRSEEGHLLVGKLPQQIALGALGIDIESHRLLPVVRYLRDQIGETAFAGDLQYELRIGPNLVGFNHQSVHFAPYQTFAVDSLDGASFDPGIRFQNRPSQHDRGLSPRTNFLVVPIRPAANKAGKTGLVVGLCWHSRAVDEAQAIACLIEVQAILSNNAD